MAVEERVICDTTDERGCCMVHVSVCGAVFSAFPTRTQKLVHDRGHQIFNGFYCFRGFGSGNIGRN